MTSMTRQHYKLIARVIKEAQISEDAARQIIAGFLHALPETNPRFKAGVFANACGHGIAEQLGYNGR